MRLLLIALFGMTLVACGAVRAPQYLQMTDNRFVITYEGPSVNTPITSIEREAMLKASQLTIDNGFHYFVVTDRTFSTRHFSAPSTIGSGSFGSSRTSIVLTIECYSANPPQNAISAEEFLRVNLSE